MEKGKGTKGGVKKKTAAGSAKPSTKTAAAQQAPLQTRGLFAKDLKSMMYGFGDAEEPFHETVELVEDITVDYISTLIQSALELAQGKDGKPNVADLLFLIRKDPAKYARAQRLLKADREIKAARKLDLKE